MNGVRIDQLHYRHPAALYRGDSDSAAVIHRQTPVGSGRGWAWVAEPAAGLDPGYLYIEYHSGDAIVYAVRGDSTDEPPQEAYRDLRLTPRGEYIETANIEQARHAVTALSEKLRIENDVIRAKSFVVAAHTDDGDWLATVGPTLPTGTRLTLRRGDGDYRTLETTAARERLERARTEAVQVEATEVADRAWFDPRRGRISRTVHLTLGPAAAD